MTTTRCQSLRPQRWDDPSIHVMQSQGIDSKAAQFNGFYQSGPLQRPFVAVCGNGPAIRFEPLFYHKSFDRFVPWEQREKACGVCSASCRRSCTLCVMRRQTMVFSCTLGCSAYNTTAKEAMWNGKHLSQKAACQVT